ncbi:hypothetical protein [Pseudoalteromonas sp. MMG005]|uniref:hypothetical protein n=1 Tax=Pseudoalteromonas sp. MMG005 TaxID=2822682 RepID=UPI001B39DCCE|nr:hypothetical protein [Pseudoalteromonas sp. MMG005]MBQ4845047.1 hypothetical protein [Pseudoalteromonas sp. MMG005]
MEFLRVVIATLGFIAGTFLIMGMLFVHFDWTYLPAGFLFYLFAYAVWPSKQRDKRDSESTIIDALEFIVELPVESIIWFFRSLGRLFRRSLAGKGDGVDVDF